MDSLTLLYFNQLPKEHLRKADTIIKHRQLLSLNTRIDTSSCDYIFIEELYDRFHRSITVTERYFKKGNERALFFLEDENLKEAYGAELTKMSEEYASGKAVKRSSYAKIWLRQHDRWCQPVKEFRKEVRKEVTSTYLVLTMINKMTRSVYVRVYFPPARAYFITVYAGGGKC